MAFDAYDRTLDLLRLLATLLERLATRDASLAKQLRRAAQSVTLNVAEGRRRVGQDQAHHYRMALGSAAEVTACLEAALALDQMELDEIVEALAMADRVRALTYRLVNRK